MLAGVCSHYRGIKMRDKYRRLQRLSRCNDFSVRTGIQFFFILITRFNGKSGFLIKFHVGTTATHDWMKFDTSSRASNRNRDVSNCGCGSMGRKLYFLFVWCVRRSPPCEFRRPVMVREWLFVCCCFFFVLVSEKETHKRHKSNKQTSGCGQQSPPRTVAVIGFQFQAWLMPVRCTPSTPPARQRHHRAPPPSPNRCSSTQRGTSQSRPRQPSEPRNRTTQTAS